jgi:hypothetical protein
MLAYGPRGILRLSLVIMQGFSAVRTTAGGTTSDAVRSGVGAS